jgi:hypothetical protein
MTGAGVGVAVPAGGAEAARLELADGVEGPAVEEATVARAPGSGRATAGAVACSLGVGDFDEVDFEDDEQPVLTAAATARKDDSATREHG